MRVLAVLVALSVCLLREAQGLKAAPRRRPLLTRPPLLGGAVAAVAASAPASAALEATPSGVGNTEGAFVAYAWIAISILAGFKGVADKMQGKDP